MKHKLLKSVLALCAAIVCYVSVAATLSNKQLTKLNEKIKDYDYVGQFTDGLALVKKAGQEYYIDKKGTITTKESGLPLSQDVRETEYFENGKVKLLYTRSGETYIVDKDQKVSSVKTALVTNQETKTIFKKKDGSYANFDDLAKMGYSPFPMGRMYMNVWNLGANQGASTIDGYVMSKNGKYGVVDSNGKELFPFINDDYGFFYWNGFFITMKIKYVDGDTGSERYVEWYDIYKDGEKIIEKITKTNYNIGYDFICFYGDDSSSFIMDKNGKEIEKVPYGENYFKYIGNSNWILENKAGESVWGTHFYLRHTRDNHYEIYHHLNNKSYLLEPNGHITSIDSFNYAAYEWFCEGVLSLNDLKSVKRKSGEPLYSDNKSLSKEDILLNLNYSKEFERKGKHTVYKEEKPGSNLMVRSEYTTDKDSYALYNADREMILPYRFDEIGYFSEGLIPVKYNGRWYYTNEKGQGLPAEALQK